MIKTYKHKYRLGDIPGDQCVSWWTTEDWEAWRQYVKDLKASGDYGKGQEVTASLVHHPHFDEKPPHKSTYEYHIIDLGINK